MLHKGQINSGSFKNGWQGYKNCKNCGNEFLATSGSRRFCDECIKQMTICPVCGKEKSIYDRFCSNSCAGKWKYQNSEKVRNAIQIGQTIAHEQEAWRKSIAKLTGRPRPQFRKENNPNWKGGTYAIERHIWMGRIEYNNWRKEIFERDNYTCQLCGEIGGRLNAHHILTWCKYPELRFDVNNGITLCKQCHQKVHKYHIKLNILRDSPTLQAIGETGA